MVNLKLSTKVKLNNGVEMPLFGLGVFKANVGGEVEDAVKFALSHGYRKIDTAAAYQNEEGVGKGIILSGVPRKEIFLTSKVHNLDQGYQSTINAFKNSLAKLQTDYLDLYLIHWPRGKQSIETWRAMEELYKKKLVKAIGVCNFQIHHFEYFLPLFNIIPAVNQIEFHPELVQSELIEYCKNKKIQIQAWRPIMQGKVNKIPTLQKLADKYEKSPVQIVLRWNVQKGIATIPKSVQKERIISNADIFDYQLSVTDLAKIEQLDRNKRLVPYYDNVLFLLSAIFMQKRKLFLTRLLVNSFINKIQYYLLKK